MLCVLPAESSADDPPHARTNKRTTIHVSVDGIQKLVQDIRDDVDAVQARRRRPGQAQFRMEDDGAGSACLLPGGAAAAPVREDRVREVRTGRSADSGRAMRLLVLLRGARRHRPLGRRRLWQQFVFFASLHSLARPLLTTDAPPLLLQTCDEVLQTLSHLRRAKRLHTDEPLDMIGTRSAPPPPPGRRPSQGGDSPVQGPGAGGERAKKAASVKLVGQRPQHLEGIAGAFAAGGGRGAPGPPAGGRTSVSYGRLRWDSMSSDEEAVPRAPGRRASLVDGAGGGVGGLRNSSSGAEDDGCGAAGWAGLLAAAAGAPQQQGNLGAGSRPTLPPQLSMGGGGAYHPVGGARMSIAASVPTAAGMARASVSFGGGGEGGPAGNAGPWARWVDARGGQGQAQAQGQEQGGVQPQPPPNPPPPGGHRAFGRRTSAPMQVLPSSLSAVSPRAQATAHASLLHQASAEAAAAAADGGGWASPEAGVALLSGRRGGARTLEPLALPGASSANASPSSPAAAASQSPLWRSSVDGGSRPMALPPVATHRSGAHRVDNHQGGGERTPNGLSPRPSVYLNAVQTVRR